MTWFWVILMLIVGIAIGWLLFRRSPNSPFTKRVVEKQQHLDKLRDFVENNPEVTNDAVRELLGVSDETAWRYLDELEQSGMIIQTGKTGRSVTYQKR